jgi:hypothetical protein
MFMYFKSQQKAAEAQKYPTAAFFPDSCLLLVKINSKRKKQVKDLLRSYSDAH